jgi:hypothetical protein
MLKKVVFPIFSVFLGYQSYKLVQIILDIGPDGISLMALFLLAFLLNLFITGVFAFVGFAYPTSRLLPDAYYQPRNPERLKHVCDLLGVKYFKTLLLLAFWGKDGNRKKYFNGTKSGIANFDYQTRQSEFGHLGGLVVVLVVSIVILLEGHYMFFVFANFINVLANLYPILLQRMHRSQIGRIISGIHAQETQANIDGQLSGNI